MAGHTEIPKRYEQRTLLLQKTIDGHATLATNRWTPF